MKFYQYYSMFLFFFMIARSVKVVYKEIRIKFTNIHAGTSTYKTSTSSIHFAQNKDNRVYQCANSLYKPCRWLFTCLIKSRSC